MKNIVFLFCLSLLLFPQLLLGQQFNFQNYSVGEGLAQSQVYSMIEDQQGYLWFGTQGGGLNRFDGKNFERFTTQEGLVNNYVNVLLEDKEGNIWVGTPQGISKFDGRDFFNYPLPKNNPVTAFAESPLGKIWVGTTKGTYQFDGQQFTDFELPSSRVNCFFYDIKGSLWIGTTENGAYLLRDEKVLKNYTILDGLATDNVRSILQDTKDDVYFGLFNGGVNVFNGSYFSYYRTDEGLSSNLVTSLFQDTDGSIWVGTEDAGITIWKRAEKNFATLNETDGLANNNVRNIVKDHWGNFWVGTSGGGVSKYSGQQFIQYSKKNGLRGNQIYSIAQSSKEKFWLGIGAKGVSFFDGKTFKNYGASEGFLDVKSKALLVDDSLRVWIGTEGRGLALYARDTFRVFTDEDGLGGNWVRDIIQDERGRIWVASASEGLTQIEVFKSRINPPPRPAGIADSLYQAPPVREEDYLTFKKYQKRNSGLTSNQINDLHLDRKNRIWLATRDNGILFFKNPEAAGDEINKVFTISQQDGLPDNHVRSLAEDANGSLWVGTANQGICKIKIYNNSFEVEKFGDNSNFNLTSNNVYQLTLDADQNLWVGTEVGVDKITLNDAGNPISSKHFGKAAGFAGIETCQNAALRDGSGNLWFGTMNGLMKYNPKSSATNLVPPILNITAVYLNYERLENTAFEQWANPKGGIFSGLKLPYDQNDLEFEFQGINHSNPEKVTYQWRLLGSKNDWTPLRERNNATFVNLPPNKYTFQLRAVNEDGIGNKTPLEMSFEIEPPFWQTWWFRIVSVLLLIFLVAWFIKSRIDRVRRKAARENEKLEMEKHLLSLEQKALQLQMNPHFIFNALNSIQSLISQKDNKKARYQLAKFSKLMRSILENSRSTTISLEDEMQTLINYLSIEQASRGNTFDFDVTFDEEIEIEALQIPPMMLQPFVENAIIHGVAHLQEAGVVQVHFSQKNKMLECSISDNGIGRAKAKLIKSQIEQQHKSMALEVTQERLDILNPNLKGQKSLEFLDLVDAEGEAVGTKVVVRLPILF